LKELYYPDDDFLEAEVGMHPSQIWWSIVEGKEVLQQEKI
jgi:hypothetical protein